MLFFLSLDNLEEKSRIILVNCLHVCMCVIIMTRLYMLLMRRYVS